MKELQRAARDGDPAHHARPRRRRRDGATRSRDVRRADRRARRPWPRSSPSRSTRTPRRCCARSRSLGMRYTEPLEAIRGMVPSPLDWPDGLPVRTPLRLRVRPVPHRGPAPPPGAAAGVGLLALHRGTARPGHHAGGRVSVAEEILVERAVPHRRAARGPRREEALPRPQGLLKRTVGQLQAVDGVDLDVYRGETLGLVGESGCGKSTLGRTLLRLLEPTARHDPASTARRHQRSARPSLKATRRHMQIVFQDSVGVAQPAHDGRQLIGEGARRSTGSARRAGPRATRRCSRCSTGSASRARPPTATRTSSRAASASGSASRARSSLQPKFIVADEPVSALDVSIQSQVLNLLVELQARVRPDLPLRRARPRGRRLHLRPRRGHVPRQDRRAGDGRGALPPAAAPVHAGAPVGEPGARAGPQAAAHRAHGRRAEPDRPAVRLPLPHALPDRAADLRRGRAAARRARPRPSRRVPLRGHVDRRGRPAPRPWRRSPAARSRGGNHVSPTSPLLLDIVGNLPVPHTPPRSRPPGVGP